MWLKNLESLLHQAVPALRLTLLLILLEDFEAEINRLKLVLFLARQHRHVEARVEKDNIFLRLRLLTVQVIEWEVIINTVEVSDVFPSCHVTGLEVSVFKLFEFIFLSLGSHCTTQARKLDTRSLNSTFFVLFSFSNRRNQAQFLALTCRYAFFIPCSVLLGLEPLCKVIKLIEHVLLANVWIGPSVHGHRLVIDDTTWCFAMLTEDSNKETTLIVVVR